MSATPFTDAAKQSVALAREAFEARNSQDPLQRIRERMSFEVNGAVLIGTGELLDGEFGAGEVAHAAIDVLASGLASLVLTLSSGNQSLALDLVGHFSVRIKRRAASHVLAPEDAIIGTDAHQPAAGQS